MVRNSGSNSLRTFTIGFEERETDESRYAASIARHLGVEQTLHVLSPVEAQNVVQQIPTIYDEPFADSSQIPQIIEPLFFAIDAAVEFLPVMNADDLKQGLEAAAAKR